MKVAHLLELLLLHQAILITGQRVDLSQAPLKHDKKSNALDPKLTNLIASDQITLHYNGSGPVPDDDITSPIPKPISPLTDPERIEDSFFQEISSILQQPLISDQCSKCLAVTEIMHLVAMSQPVSMVTSLLIRICYAFPNFRDGSNYATDCRSDFSEEGGLGPYYAQLFSHMSFATGDMLMWCAYQEKVCPQPAAIKIDESLYFEPKPDHAYIVPEPSGEMIDVLHLSDWHLDVRYDIGSEGNCTGYMCCRPNSENTELHTNSRNASIPASRFGSFNCDSPPDLALSAFSDMHSFFNLSTIAFSIFTGDLVSHDHDNKLSKAYVAYEEEVSYRAFKTMLGQIPLYVTLGNHDSMPRAFNTPHILNPEPENARSNALSWNYELVSSLWHKYGWLSEDEASFAAAHYGAYATTTKQGLRIISFNADFWFRNNIFNYFNTTNPDSSGMLKWMASELSECEARGQRVWLIAHVLSGYDGSQSLPNPTALFYSIVRRFSPATIAGVFFGHTHQDQIHLFYDFLPHSLDSNSAKPHLRNTSAIDESKPLQVAYIGPSISPLTGLNSGYRVYQVDAKTFSVMGHQTYVANISNSLDWERPVWQFEYDARQEYAKDVQPCSISSSRNNDGDPSGDRGTDKNKHEKRICWPASSPLNGSFWHAVSEEMIAQSANSAGASFYNPYLYSKPGSREELSLFHRYTMFSTKSSNAKVHRGSDSSQISVNQQVCYLQSGNTELASRCKDIDNGGRRDSIDPDVETSSYAVEHVMHDCGSEIGKQGVNNEGTRGIFGGAWRAVKD